MENKFPSAITNDEVAAMPTGAFAGEIVVVEDEDALTRACAELRTQSIIGFDTETRPSFKAGVVHRVALLQLSTEKRCYLIRLCKVRLERQLVRILESPEIVKVGADVNNDLRTLQKLRRFRAEGFVDLQSIVGEWGIAEKSVRKMAAIILGTRVSKAQRLSNWEAAQLTDAQQLYAATDAWICLEMYLTLKKTKQ